MRGFLPALAVAASLAFAPSSGAEETAFLDRPLPPGIEIQNRSGPSPEDPKVSVEFPCLSVHSYAAGVELLGKLSSKKVLLPDGIAEWLKARPQAEWGMGLGIAKDQQVRPLFEHICLLLGLVWHYDPQQDAILLDFKWRRDDPRSGRELAGIVGGTKPVPWEKLPHGARNGVGGIDPALDEWRVAFDALCSQPANFPYCARVRLYHDMNGNAWGMGMPVTNLFAGSLRDEGGHPVVVVLNQKLQLTSKESPGSVAYYLFDEKGQFIKGGVYSMRPSWVDSIAGAHADDERRLTIDFGWRTKPDHLHFALAHGDLVLTGSTMADGKEENAEETRVGEAGGRTGCGQLEYGISGKDPVL